MSDVTRILNQIEAGNTGEADRLFPLVYDELRRLAAQKMAGERFDHTLQGTALVHEVYLRLVGSANDRHWNSRGHFFGAAAEAMRRILIDHARRRAAHKRGGDRHRIDAENFAAGMPIDPDLLLDLDAGLSRLAEEDPEAAELVKLRLFAGLSTTEAGALLGMSRSTAHRNWEYVRSWFSVYAGPSTDGC